jgi:transcriptional regulator with XRE-family HTH domain
LVAERPESADPGERLIDPVELGDRLRAKRRSQKLSIRQAADETGVSAPTLSRVERGHLPDSENLLRLARWAGLRIDPATARAARNRAVHDPSASTLEAIELHLRADKDLTRDDAEALTEMFRVAYEHLADKKKPGGKPE